MEREGLTFYIHIDGAWGGYFASTLNNNKQVYIQVYRFTGLQVYIHIDGAWGGYFASTLNNNKQVEMYRIQRCSY